MRQPHQLRICIVSSHAPPLRPNRPKKRYKRGGDAGAPPPVHRSSLVHGYRWTHLRAGSLSGFKITRRTVSVRSDAFRVSLSSAAGTGTPSALQNGSSPARVLAPTAGAHVTR